METWTAASSSLTSDSLPDPDSEVSSELLGEIGDEVELDSVVEDAEELRAEEVLSGTVEEVSLVTYIS